MSHQDPRFSPELDKNLRAALNDPLIRIGTVHKVEKTFPYGDGYPPFICFTFSWLEPYDDDNRTPQVFAMDLHVADFHIHPIIPTLNDLAREARGRYRRPPGRHGSRAAGKRNPRR